MKIIFAGTPDFAATALKALLDAGSGAGFNVVAVYTQPDRPAGRGMKLTASAVKTLALSHGIPVFDLRRRDRPRRRGHHFPDPEEMWNALD